MRLVLGGWGLAILVATLVVVVNGLREVGFSLILAVLAAAMGAWVWRRATRAALVTSLALGLLLLLMFGAYTVADATADEFESQRIFTDMIGAIGGAAIVAGAVQVLVEQRRARRARPA